MAGATGRMGKMILTLVHESKGFKIAGALEYAGHPSIGQDIGEILGIGETGVKITSDPKVGLKASDVLIDFSLPAATSKNLKAVLKQRIAYVIGTTGLSKKNLKEIKLASKKIPIVESPNMSVGVNLLFKLAELAARVLDENYDIEITEVHHRMKKDAPSGTAMKLLEILAGARGRNVAKDSVFGRKGQVGARKKGEIGVFALRGGDVVGDHTVSFFGDAEKVELVHKASSRVAFAKGALFAAKFLAKKGQGLYHMQDVLRLC